MTTKTNLTQPTYNSIDWNVPLNANFGVLNNALGNTEYVSVALGDVTLDTTQSQNMRIGVTGVLTANRTLFFPAGLTGSWVVTNATTGAYTLTVRNVSGSGSVTVTQGTSAIVWSDGTNIAFANDSYSAAGSVTTAMIADGAVTNPKLGYWSVTADKIADGNVTAAKLAAGAISTTSIAYASVTPDKMSGGQTGSAPAFAARAWGYAVYASGVITRVSGGNFASVSRTGTGQYSCVFNTAMPDANYAAVVTPVQGAGGDRYATAYNKTIYGFAVSTRTVNAQSDVSFNFIVVG